jgi:hypothetical protein
MLSIWSTYFPLSSQTLVLLAKNDVNESLISIDEWDVSVLYKTWGIWKISLLRECGDVMNVMCASIVNISMMMIEMRDTFVTIDTRRWPSPTRTIRPKDILDIEE